ncbi:unknown protein [Spodoptera frugiperda multiple nucleopolyhedrovirus]|uniref:Uncharacterized protein n=1 Tax=Spodoptera frugiperda nuclear polyhedrosis virus TaxID=10455 RepID=A1YJ20_NPVSF|nr:hypothetical protein SFMNPV_gp030 [Spodoptera frugiperda multiple nucleopolyhedrovirus]ABM45854.1 unknown protein [Spodoptera frugiperda multiple nucleopolyhedrovirus]QED39943.1 hypothetical protein [Spodoptera frugiperda multiple nucleopolyhedrovirus]
MSVNKFALTTINMYDKIEHLTRALNDLQDFVDSHVTERDYLGLGYTSREKFVNDVVDAILYIQVRESFIKLCTDDNENFNTLTSRRLVNIEQYKCKNCGTLNNFCSTINDNKYNNDEDSDNDEKHNNAIVSDTNNNAYRRNAMLFISKWTIFKLLTELFLWARCWLWGYCEKPWYILWSKKNK